MTKDPSLVLVGVFGAAHGVRGEIRLKSFTGDPAAIGDYALSSKTGEVFKLDALRPIKDNMFVARIAGVSDRTGAEKLTNVEIYVNRAQLPPADEDEFYYSDLIGLRAESAAGELIGHVRAVENFGAGDIVEIIPPSGDSLLLPFTKAVVPVVDVAGGKIIVELPEVVDEGESA